jgi:hypothetical protein
MRKFKRINSVLKQAEFTYDDAGNMLERISYSKERLTGKDVYSYDASPKLESVTGYDSLNGIVLTIRNGYNENRIDEQGNLF